MSLEDLDRMGLLRQDEPGPVESRVRLASILATVTLAIAGCVTMVLGDGSALSWIGVVAFLIGLSGFIGVNLKAVG